MEGVRDFLAGVTPRHRDDFLHSSAYYLLTGRNGCWLAVGGHSSAVVCWHPHLPDTVLVFPELGGQRNYSLSVAILDSLRQGVIPQLARLSVGLDAINARLQKASRGRLSARLRPEVHLDWIYPLRLIQTAPTAAMSGGRFMRVRNKYRLASRAVVATVRLEDCVDPGGEIQAALRRWQVAMTLRGTWTEDIPAFYHCMADMLSRPSCPLEGLLFRDHAGACGFSVWECICEERAILLANACDTTTRGLADYQIVTTCAVLAERGVRTLNLGGSELASLDAFKSKFAPLQSTPCLSADVVRTGFSNGVPSLTVFELLPPAPMNGGPWSDESVVTSLKY